MTWWAIWRTDTGELVSLTDRVTDPFPFGRSARRYDDKPDGTWNAVTRVFDPLPVVHPRVITTQDFINRFTLSEVAAIKSAEPSDPLVAAFLLKLQVSTNEGVHLDGPDVQMGLPYLVSKGLITADRIPQITE